MIIFSQHLKKWIFFFLIIIKRYEFYLYLKWVMAFVKKKRASHVNKNALCLKVLLLSSEAISYGKKQGLKVYAY
jgi:hypothetical protein